MKIHGTDEKQSFISNFVLQLQSDDCDLDERSQSVFLKVMAKDDYEFRDEAIKVAVFGIFGLLAVLFTDQSKDFLTLIVFSKKIRNFPLDRNWKKQGLSYGEGT